MYLHLKDLVRIYVESKNLSDVSWKEDLIEDIAVELLYGVEVHTLPKTNSRFWWGQVNKTAKPFISKYIEQQRELLLDLQTLEQPGIPFYIFTEGRIKKLFRTGTAYLILEDVKYNYPEVVKVLENQLKKFLKSRSVAQLLSLYKGLVKIQSKEVSVCQKTFDRALAAKPSRARKK